MPFSASFFIVFFLSLITVEKMKMIDQEYENSNSGDKWFSFQSKLAAYRKEMEAQLQAEMNTKVLFFSSKLIEYKNCLTNLLHNHICNKQHLQHNTDMNAVLEGPYM